MSFFVFNFVSHHLILNTLIFLIENKNALKVVKICDHIESKIGFDNFIKLFGLILTDQDPSFADFEGFENPKYLAKNEQIFFIEMHIEALKKFL